MLNYIFKLWISNLLEINENHSYQQIGLWNGQKQLDECVEGIVESIIAVQMEHPKVNIVATQSCLQH